MRSTALVCLFGSLLLPLVSAPARAADAPAVSELDVLPAELADGPKSKMLQRYLSALAGRKARFNFDR